nr:Nephrin [Novocrania anomala]
MGEPGWRRLVLALAFCFVVGLDQVGPVHAQFQSFRVAPNDTTVIQGDNVILPCAVDNIQGALQWAKGGFVLGYDYSIPGFPRYTVEGNFGIGEYNMVIRDAKLTDDDEFQCQILPTSTHPLLQAIMWLTVMVPPETPVIVGYSNGSDVNVQQTTTEVNLTCRVDNGKPAPEVTWLKNNEPATELVQYSTERLSNKLINAKSIIALKPRREDNGAIYSCRATHKALRGRVLETYIRLSVFHPPDPPTITGYNQNDILRTGQTVTLQCTSVGGNPLAQVVWYKNDQQIDFSYTTGGNRAVNDLAFTVDSTDNNAVYRCEVTNVVHTLPMVASVTLKVYFSPEKVTINGHQNARAGETITLSCISAKSNPASVITWISRGRQLSGAVSAVVPSPEGGYITTSNISVKLTDQENNVVYACQGTNDQLGETTRTEVSLRVLYPPFPPTIEGYTENTSIRAGTIQKLKCLCMGGNPIATLTWWKGDKQMPAVDKSVGTIASSEISFIAKEDDNQASYRCNATNPATAEPLIVSVKLTVHFPPKSVTITTDPPVAKANEKLTVTCTSSSSNPASVITWWKDGSVVKSIAAGVADAENGGIKTSNKLEITLSPSNDMDTYECQARNDVLAMTVHDAITLDVLFPPIFSGTPPQISVVEGEYVVTNFTGIANPPVTNYTWFKHGTKLKLSKLNLSRTRRDLTIAHFYAAGGVLNMTNVSRADKGEYRVEATNGQGIGKVNFTLDVQYPAAITKITTPVYADNGDTAFIECLAEANPVVPNMIKWSRAGYTMSPAKTRQVYGEGKSFLTVYNVSKHDSGAFVCTAQNGIGSSATKIAELLVKYAPEIDKSPMYAKAASDKGMTGKLTCRAKGVPVVEFTWLKGNTVLNTTHAKYRAVTKKIDTVTYESNLHVMNVSQSDYATYICKGKNALGEDQTSVSLDGTSKPDVPYNISVVAVNGHSVTLGWTPGFNGGLVTTFRVRYRALGTDASAFKYADTSSNNKFILTELSPNTRYEITVKAINKKGESTYQMKSIQATTKPEKTGQVILGINDSVVVILALSVSLSVIMGVTIVVVIFCIRRRRQRLRREQAASDAASSRNSSAPANTIEMYAPSDRPLYPNGGTYIDDQSYNTYDKNMDDFATDSYRSFDDDEDVKRVFLPQPPNNPQAQRYTPAPRSSPAVDTQRTFMVPENPNVPGEFISPPRGTNARPYVGNDTDNRYYAEQLRQNQLQRSLGAVQPDLVRLTPTKTPTLPPNHPLSQSQRSLGTIPQSPAHHPSIVHKVSGANPNMPIFPPQHPSIIHDKVSGPANILPIPARNYATHEMPPSTVSVPAIPRRITTSGTTDMRPSSRPPTPPVRTAQSSLEMRGHLV